jgi:hypothetical protein
VHLKLDPLFLKFDVGFHPVPIEFRAGLAIDF